MSEWDTPNIIASNRQVRLNETAQVLEFPPDSYVKMRLIGPLFSIVYYWFKIKTKNGKIVDIPKICLDYDPIKQKFISDVCPFRASGKGRMQQIFYSNAIIRELQESQPRKLAKPSKNELKKRALIPGGEKEYHIKEQGSSTWTPVRLVKITATTMDKLVKLGKSNSHETKNGKKTFSLAHPVYGRDIAISFDPNAKGTAMYDLQKENRSKISPKEQEYLMQPFFTDAIKPMELKDAQAEMKRIAKTLEGAETDKEDDETEANKRKKDKKRDNNRDSSNSSRKDKKERREDKNERRKDKKTKKNSNRSKKKESPRDDDLWDDDIPF
jgi:hypothetical protein